MENEGVGSAWSPRALVDAARRRGELVVLAVVAVLALTLAGGPAPAGVYGFGTVAGAGLALNALGFVLVFRANRIVNFAQIQLGVAAGMLFGQMTIRRTFLAGLHKVCSTCLGDPDRVRIPAGLDPDELSQGEIAALGASGWLVTLNTILSIAAGLAAAMLITWIVYHLVVKRFAEAPRVVLTLVTIAVGTIVAALGLGLGNLFPGEEGAVEGRPRLPFRLTFDVAGTTFEEHDLMRVVMAAVAVVVLGVYLRRSTVGVALRGVADNPSRAETLGVPVKAVTGRVWVFAALLSGIVSILDSAAVGLPSGTGSGTLIRSLAPAVVAGFTSLPVVVVAALVIGIFDQVVLNVFNSALLTEGILLVVVVAALLALKARRGRADTEASTLATSREVRPIPQELRHLPTVTRWIRTGVVTLVVVGAALPWVLSPAQTNQASVALVFGIVALSLLVLTGWAGQISLGQIGLAAVGAWVAAALGWPFPFGLLVAAVAGAVVAAAVGVPALRLPGLFLAVSTLAFAVAVPAILLNPQYLAKALPANVPRPVVLGVDLADERAFFYVVVVFVALATVSVLGMRRSRTARALVAARDNEAAAQSFGIDIFRARVTAFAVSGFLAAVAGVLLSYAAFGVESQLFGPEQSVRAFLVAVVGGLGSVAGPLVGTVTLMLFTLVPFPVGPDVLLALLTVGLLITSPGGLTAALARGRDAVLRRVAERNGIDVPSLVPEGATLGGPAPIDPVKDTYVPRRYRLDGNWVVPSTRDDSFEEVGSRG